MDSHEHDHEFTDRIDRLNDPIQYRYLSAEELREHLNPAPHWIVADLGSGTGFYTSEIALVVDTVYAVDIAAEMHAAYRENGMPANVTPITADVSDIQLPNDALDAAVSLRTYHHGVNNALGEIARVMKPGGRFVIVDWSATGAGDRDRGPVPPDCFDLATVQSDLLDVGFRIVNAHERRETFVVIATRRPS